MAGTIENGLDLDTGIKGSMATDLLAPFGASSMSIWPDDSHPMNGTSAGKDGLAKW